MTTQDKAFALIQKIGLSGLECESTGKYSLHWEVSKNAALAALDFLLKNEMLAYLPPIQDLRGAVSIANTRMNVEDSTFHELQIAKAALVDIMKWNDNLDTEWNDQGERAKAALRKITH